MLTKVSHLKCINLRQVSPEKNHPNPPKMADIVQWVSVIFKWTNLLELSNIKTYLRCHFQLALRCPFVTLEVAKGQSHTIKSRCNHFNHIVQEIIVQSHNKIVDLPLKNILHPGREVRLLRCHPNSGEDHAACSIP